MTEALSPLVVVVVFDGVDLLDVTGPPEVLALARREAPDEARYEVVLAAVDCGPVRTSAGVRVLPDITFGELHDRAIDTLIVPGAVTTGEDGVLEPVIDPHLVNEVAILSRHARRVASVCVGAHILAEAGILDGRTVTTHWSTAAHLARSHPRVTVNPEPIFIRDGRVWTAAGISSCLDLTLALVAADLGEAIALRVAKQLVMYLKRPGGQSQFSIPLEQVATTRRMERIRHHVLTNLHSPLTIPELARVAQVGERQLSRLFHAEVGTSPRAYVESLRVESVRRDLEGSDEGLARIAERCGFANVAALQRAFRKAQGMTPTEYRQRFRMAPP